MTLAILTCHVKSLKTIQVMVHIFLFVLENLLHASGNCKKNIPEFYT